VGTGDRVPSTSRGKQTTVMGRGTIYRLVLEDPQILYSTKSASWALASHVAGNSQSLDVDLTVHNYANANVVHFWSFFDNSITLY
jgi:hypothetical protein